MIPRTVVPRDCRLPVADAPLGQRRTTWLDTRTLLPASLPAIPFTGGTTIPAHVPLTVLENRVLVPRDLPVIPLELAPAKDGVPPAVTEIDRRLVVPPGAALQQMVPVRLPVKGLRELGEGGWLVEGEPRLLPESTRGWSWEWLAPVCSIALHLLLLLALLETSRELIGRPTPEELALEQQRIGYIYLPRNVEKIPRLPERQQKPSDQIRIDLGALKRLAPPKPEVSVEEGKLSAPVSTPSPSVSAPLPSAPAPRAASPEPPPRPERPKVTLEPVTPNTSRPLFLPQLSPGRALEQSARAALAERQAGIGFADRLPPPPAGSPGRAGGPGPGYLAGSLQVLTPTEGVDFTSYFARMLAAVRRNWYTLMPESARLGDRGRVVLRFRILHNGQVPEGEPILELSSGKDPLDRAAVGAITLSVPFEPLPQAFTGPYIELRFIFLYNLPLDSQ